jgi:hypothetical protein
MWQAASASQIHWLPSKSFAVIAQPIPQLLTDHQGFFRFLDEQAVSG